MDFLSASSTLSALSFTNFSMVKISCSALFFDSTLSLRFLSSSAYFSASLTAASMSFSDRLLLAVRVIDWLLLVALSTADTDTMPFASISKVTSICGTPRGAGAMPTSENLPRVLLSFANSRSPCNTWISTLVWLSVAVEKICDFLVGIVVFLSISFVQMPPKVSMPSDNGVTSRRRTSFTSPARTPA